mgnify:FL=1
MKKYWVPIIFEERVLICIKAKNEDEAISKSESLVNDYGGTDYPKEYKQDWDSRNWTIQSPIEEKI